MEIKLHGVNRKNFAISIQQKCVEFYKPRRTKINFDKITLSFKNLVPNTTSFQLFNYVHTYPQLKNIFLWLEIERLGNCRLCFLNNELRSNVNTNSWIKNERNSSEGLFLWFWLAYLWFHYLDIFQEFLIIQNLISLHGLLPGKYGNLIRPSLDNTQGRIEQALREKHWFGCYSWWIARVTANWSKG